MLYLAGFVFALLRVVGQTLYKLAVEASGFALNSDFLFSSKVFGFIFSWQLIAGVAAYAFATAINFWMFTKYEFSSIQAVGVPLVLVMSFIAGWWLFKDELSMTNVVGLFILIFGVILATHH